MVPAKDAVLGRTAGLKARLAWSIQAVELVAWECCGWAQNKGADDCSPDAAFKSQ